MLIDVTKIRSHETNVAIEYLAKSVEDRLLFEPHPTDGLLGAMEELSFEPVRQALQRLHAETLRILVGGLGPVAKAVEPDAGDRCRDLERLARDAPPGGLALTDYLDMVECLIRKYLPARPLLTAVQRGAVRQYLTGYLRHDLGGTPAADPARAVRTLPETLTAATAAWPRLTDRDVARITVAQASAARHVTDLTAATRSRMHRLILDAERRRMQTGDRAYAPQPLQQALADTFGELNRDWRRVAVTETSIHANDGVLAATSVGEQVRWLAHPGACVYCASMQGRVFTVVAPDAPHKDPETQVWPGKHVMNVGRALAKRKRLEDGTLVDREPEELVVPAIPGHAHCRCLWVPHVALTEEQRRLLGRA